MLDLILAAQSSADDGSVSTKVLYGIVSVIITAVVGTLMKHQGKQQGREEVRNSTTITNQPLIVAMEEKFVKLEDFREFKAEAKGMQNRLEGLFEKTMTKVEERDRAVMLRMDDRDKAMVERLEERDEKLTAKIEKVASGAYEARGKIHQKVNSHGESIAVMEAKADIAGQIGKLADAMTEALTATAPTRTKRNLPS